MRREDTDVCVGALPKLECHLPGVRPLVYKKGETGESQCCLGCSEMF